MTMMPRVYECLKKALMQPNCIVVQDGAISKHTLFRWKTVGSVMEIVVKSNEKLMNQKQAAHDHTMWMSLLVPCCLKLLDFLAVCTRQHDWHSQQ